MRLLTTTIILAAVGAVALPTLASAQAITRGRAIVDRPKKAAPAQQCRVINVPVTQANGSVVMQPRQVCG
ncbi:MAG: hypothetical protein KIT85_02460 [Pseudolabrys sp.]|nr:hypothetical protein [Pseudolabrys sp.]